MFNALIVYPYKISIEFVGLIEFMCVGVKKKAHQQGKPFYKVFLHCTFSPPLL